MKIHPLILAIGILFGASTPPAAAASMRLYDLVQKETLEGSAALGALASKRIVLVGEHHTRKHHHLAQLQVIRALHRSGVPLAVGLEMFRKESQSALDGWISGTLSEARFKRAYAKNWNFPWSLYRPIFTFTRQNRIPLVSLNVSSEITRQVAREGFESLSKEQRGEVSDVVCRVDDEYMEFIRNAFGAHAHGDLNFLYFCEAQLVWDTAMAVHAIQYLTAHPETTLVALTGAGHAWKGGIPRQIRERSGLTVAVVLPETPGSIEPDRIEADSADYILLDAHRLAEE